MSNVHISFARAEYAIQVAMRKHKTFTRFDDLGTERILYSVRDTLLLEQMGKDMLAPLLSGDTEKKSELVETLFCYLKHNGSVKSVADEMFIHKNTIVYRMGKIKELLGCDLESGEERMQYYLACLIVRKEM